MISTAMISTVNNFLDQFPVLAEALKTLQGRTGLKQEHVVGIVLLAPMTVLILGYLAPSIYHVTCFAYPIYMSTKAIHRGHLRDSTRWLVYWLILNTIQLMEAVFAGLVAIFPVYKIFKVLILAWAVAPIELNGSVVLYQLCLRSLCLKLTEHLEGIIGDASGHVADILRERETHVGAAAVNTFVASNKATNSKQLNRSQITNLHTHKANPAEQH